MEMFKKLIAFSQKHIDKILHLLMCYVIVFTFMSFGHPFIGLIVALVLGIGKEIYDKISSNKWDWYDLLADLSGMVLGILFGLFV